MRLVQGHESLLTTRSSQSILIQEILWKAAVLTPSQGLWLIATLHYILQYVTNFRKLCSANVALLLSILSGRVVLAKTTNAFKPTFTYTRRGNDYQINYPDLKLVTVTVMKIKPGNLCRLCVPPSIIQSDDNIIPVLIDYYPPPPGTLDLRRMS
eukprot:1310934-Amphidinium_carterae.1